MMRISSRGTVSMGLLGWLVIGPVIVLGWAAFQLVRLLIMLCVVSVRFLVRRFR